MHSAIFERLEAIVGSANVLTDEASCILYSQDIFTKAKTGIAVVSPDNKDELAQAVGAATEAGYNVIPRGGGMSYTRGYVPNSDNSIIFDLSRMNRVLEVNSKDMYVTVEAGCTWQQLYEHLKGTEYRTPFWGTMSGAKATVGGGMSQNAIFWGSGQYGSAVDTVIGMEVVIADGSIIKTGSAAQVNSQPFFRHYGPDLTGLFTCDVGALGFKATITLKLLKKLSGKQFCAFDFATGESAMQALSEIARQGLAMECFGFDPCLQKHRLKRQTLAQDVSALKGVMKASGSILGAVKDGAKIALAGRRYMDDVQHSVQVMVEDFTQSGADARAKEVVRIALEHGGREIENSIPKIARANPFGPLNAVVGGDGKRWIPVHALVSHSNVMADYQAVLDLFEKYQSSFDKYQVDVGFLYAAIGNSVMVLEPVFFWPDVPEEIHQATVEPDYLAKLEKHPKDLEARALIKEVREEFARMFHERGGVHIQIGKFYHYADGIEPENLKLIQALKKALDPNGRVNPGALGLN